LADVVGLLPSGALANGLTDALAAGTAPGPGPYLVLAFWAVLPAAVATRTTRLSLPARGSGGTPGPAETARRLPARPRLR
jgi:hypothetical protein